MRVTDAGALGVMFWVLAGLSVVLYPASLCVPPIAFLVWTML